MASVVSVLWGLAQADDNIHYDRIREFCETETFTATCAANEVINIASARYGRMRLGRCVRKDLGYIGCYADVLHLTDKRCSGRTSCKIRLPDPQFDMTRPCLEELKTYFETSYSCAKVWAPPTEGCNGTKFISLREGEGTVASVVTLETGCGGPLHPYVIRALEGQRINITMTDYSLTQPTSGVRHDSHEDTHENCRSYAIIIDAKAKKREVVCGGRRRTQLVMLSEGHEVELRLTPATAAREIAFYILHYTVVGCADLEAAEGTWIKRTGDGATIGCQGTEQEWKLRCVGNTWTGMVGNCSHYGLWIPETQNSPPSRMSYGTSILVILVIAFLIGVIVFIIGFVSFKRCHKAPAQKRRQPIYFHKEERPMVELDEKSHTLDFDKNRKQEGMCPHGAAHHVGKDCNDYAHIWETTLPHGAHTRRPTVETIDNTGRTLDRRRSQPELFQKETNLDLIQPARAGEISETMPRTNNKPKRPIPCEIPHEHLPRYFVLDRNSVLVEEPSACAHLLQHQNLPPPIDEEHQVEFGHHLHHHHHHHPFPH